NLPHGCPSVHFCSRHVGDVGAILVGVPVVHPADVVLVGSDGQASETGNLRDTSVDGLGLHRMGQLPFMISVPVDAANSPDQRCSAGAGFCIGQAGKRCACLAV